MKTLGKLESTEQMHGLFLRCGGGRKKGFGRHDCICFSFSLIFNHRLPHFPLEPLD